jgi:hypothetical protein
MSLTGRGLTALDSSYFQTVASFRHGTAIKVVNRLEVVKYLRPAYDRFKGITGYAPIMESAVYANLSRWDADPWTYLEIADAEAALRELAGQDSAPVRVVSDRFRRPETFRLLH